MSDLAITVWKDGTHTVWSAADAGYAQNDPEHLVSIPLGSREQLARLAHEQWCHWMQHLFTKATDNHDGTITISAPLVGRWLRQIGTPYADLSEAEKDSDREQADKVLALLKETLKP